MIEARNLLTPIQPRSEQGMRHGIQSVLQRLKEYAQPKSLYDQVFRKFTDGVRAHGYEEVIVVDSIIPRMTRQIVVCRNGDRTYDASFIIHDTNHGRIRMQDVMLHITEHADGIPPSDQRRAVIWATRASLVPSAPPNTCPYGVDPTEKLKRRIDVYKGIIGNDQIGRREADAFLRDLLSAEVDTQKTQERYQSDKELKDRRTISLVWLSPSTHQPALEGDSTQTS